MKRLAWLFVGSFAWLATVSVAFASGDKQLNSYESLRAISGIEGQVIELNSTELAGAFIFRSKQKDLFDDGGTIIKAKNGWWVRDFVYDRDNPIQLKWFQIQEGDDITGLLTSLAKRYAPYFYLQLPDNISRLGLNYIDLSSYRIIDFVLLEASTPIEIVQSDLVKDANKLIEMNDYRHVYIGGPSLNLTFSGLHRGVRGGHNVNLYRAKPEGLLSFKRRARYFENSFEFRANIRDSRVFGIDHRGEHRGNSRTPQAFVAGNFLNSGLRFNGGVQNITFEDVWLSDPYAVALGWDGTTKQENGTKSGRRYSERSRGVSVVYADKVSGSINLEYGRPRWFFSQIKMLGSSASEPLVLRYKDLGYTQNGVQVSTRGYLATGGKVDSLGGGGEHYLSFEELDHDFGYALKHSVILEATSEDGHGGARYINEGVNVRLNNISKSVITSLVDYSGDFSGRHTVTGSMSKCDIGSGGIVQQPRLIVHQYDRVENFTGCVIELRYNERIKQAAIGNTLSNITIVDSGYIQVGAGAQKNVFQNLQFLGDARTVINIANAAAPDKIVSIEMEGIKAPSGSRIVATNPGVLELTLDGELIALPYTFK